jgi:hypothetical protein
VRRPCLWPKLARCAFRAVHGDRRAVDDQRAPLLGIRTGRFALDAPQHVWSVRDTGVRVEPKERRIADAPSVTHRPWQALVPLLGRSGLVNRMRLLPHNLRVRLTATPARFPSLESSSIP